MHVEHEPHLQALHSPEILDIYFFFNGRGVASATSKGGANPVAIVIPKGYKVEFEFRLGILGFICVERSLLLM
jgi:hypothetical protein